MYKRLLDQNISINVNLYCINSQLHETYLFLFVESRDKIKNRIITYPGVRFVYYEILTPRMIKFWELCLVSFEKLY